MDFDTSTPTYAHDANGNLTSDGVFQYQYDSANQLTNVIRLADNARVLSARYDALGRRVEATRADGSVERYVYFPGSFLVLAVLDGSNAVKEVYTRGPDFSSSLDGAGGIGGILACTYASGATYYSHADIMGNVIALTDASGSVAATFRYTPFGQLSARTGTLLPRYLFSSKEFDRSASLYYYGYRYYAPRLGRWMTRDPKPEDIDANLYRFCGNSVPEEIDPLGLMVMLKNLFKIQNGTSRVEGNDTWEDCSHWFNGNQTPLGPNSLSGNNWGNGVPPIARAVCHGKNGCAQKTCGKAEVVQNASGQSCCEHILLCEIVSIETKFTGEQGGHSQIYVNVEFDCRIVGPERPCGSITSMDLERAKSLAKCEPSVVLVQNTPTWHILGNGIQ